MSHLIVITGFMGCGKSEVARSLAQRLGLEMIDLDEFITAAVGRTPAQLIDEEGEAVFRNIEANNLANVLKTGARRVIALGGGAWIENRNRELLANAAAIGVWLDTPFEVCWTRIESATEARPLARTKNNAYDLYERRRPIYELATIKIQTRPEQNPDEIAASIERQLLSSK